MESMRVLKWVETQIASIEERINQPPEQKLEITQSICFIASLLQGNTSAAETASAIAATFKPRMNTHHSTNFKSLWGIIATATRIFTDVECQRLVDLYFAIKDLPEVTNKHGFIFKVDGKDPWGEIPDWGWVYWEHGLDLDWRYDTYLAAEDDKEKWFEQGPGKLNSTTFAASILARAGLETEMWIHGSRAMIDALEIPYDTSPIKVIRNGVGILGDPLRELEGEWKMYIPPAVEWIMVAGERLYEFSFCEIVDEEMKVQSKGWRWGDRYFSRGRWNFWRERFRELEKWEDVDEQCRGLIGKALEKMEMLEAKSEHIGGKVSSLES